LGNFVTFDEPERLPSMSAFFNAPAGLSGYHPGESR
jgi:hypothetical protein